MKNASEFQGELFDDFVHGEASANCFKRVSEIICAGLGKSENEELKTVALRNSIQTGIESGIATDFKREDFLELKQSVEN